MIYKGCKKNNDTSNHRILVYLYICSEKNNR